MTASERKRIVIIGAGNAGKEIAREIRRKPVLGEIICFLDDDIQKVGAEESGIPVSGTVSDAPEILKNCGADEVIIAIPSLPKHRFREIYALIQRCGVAEIKFLPTVSQIISGDARLILTRNPDAEDLLGRTPVTIPLRESLRYLRGKRVLITGAGGSIGSELARQLLYGGSQRLYLLDNGEEHLYHIQNELKMLQDEGIGADAKIVSVICNLIDEDHLRSLLRRLRCDVIFHCAAYKHVPVMEENPVECIKNNVFGTENLIEAAKETEVEKILLISTDKAVEPSCVYGVSKELCEDLILAANGGRHTFTVVRFGNVIASSGSIVPLFKAQIEKGGPLTLTHPDVSRYFMTIPEAVSLVLRAGGVGKGGETYILDMGKPVLIRELAEQLIACNGFEPYKDIPIVITGLRKGEKVTERLYAENETVTPTGYPKIGRLNRADAGKPDPAAFLAELRPICFLNPEKRELYRNRHALRALLKRYAPTLQDLPDEPEF